MHSGLLTLAFIAAVSAGPLTSRATISCPWDDGELYTVPGTIDKFRIECRTDRQGGDMPGNPVWVSSIEACIAACDSTDGCVDVVYSPGTPGPCYLKNEIMQAVDNRNTISAVKQSSTCPAIGNQDFYVSTDVYYTAECGKDRSGPVMMTLSTTTFEDCFEACEAHVGCVVATFQPASDASNGGTCYLRSTVGRVQSNGWTSSYIGGVRHGICPDKNGTHFETDAGNAYVIECGIDHFGGNLAGPIWVDSLTACIAECDATAGCVDVSWSRGFPQGACFLKSSVGGVKVDATVYGAKLISA